MKREGTAEESDVTPSAPNHRGHQLLRDKLVGTKLGRYDLLHRLASGGMGSVYVGRARGVGDFERLVAIKVLHEHLAHQEDFVGMFLDEARLAAQIRHPNVVATVDVCPTPEGYFLVMDYIEGDHLGGLLRAAMRKGELLPVPVVLRIVVDSLMGLAAAHGLKDRTGTVLNLVHRDISPQNVLVGVDGMARLTDFGVAKAEHRISSTREGQFKGKLAYASPEQAATGEVEQRSDLFGMGVVMWEALTAKRLFGADTNQATLRRLLEEPIPALSLVRPDLAALDPFMAKALARDRDERFQTAQEMAEAIELVAPQVGGLATTRGVAQSVRTLSKDKLEAEHAAIERAIAEHKKLSSRPPAPTGVSVGEDVDTVRPPALGARGGSRAKWIAAAAALLLVAGAVAWWASGDDEEADVVATGDDPSVVGGGESESEAEGESETEGESEAEGESETEGEGLATGGGTNGEAGAQPTAMTEGATEMQETGSGTAMETDPGAAARERAARERRWRAARRRQGGMQQATGTSEMAETTTSMDEIDILANPYRND